MRFIKTNTHNIADYIFGIFITASPWLFGFSNNGAETYVPVAAGFAIIVLSFFTDYRYSLKKMVAYNAHLTLELTAGIFLAASPWLFGFHPEVYLPHLISGGAVILLSLMSQKFINYKAYN